MRSGGGGHRIAADRRAVKRERARKTLAHVNVSDIGAVPLQSVPERHKGPLLRNPLSCVQSFHQPAGNQDLFFPQARAVNDVCSQVHICVDDQDRLHRNWHYTVAQSHPQVDIRSSFSAPRRCGIGRIPLPGTGHNAFLLTASRYKAHGVAGTVFYADRCGFGLAA